MQIDAFDWFKFIYLTSLILLTRIIFIVDTTTPIAQVPHRHMCSKIQSMLSTGKYYTSQMSSNITYVSRVYAQNFLAYSPLDDILIFIEPKHQLHVYNPQSVRLIVNIPTTNVVYATSCTSLTTDDRHDLFFIYETRLDKNLISIRVCEIYFNRLTLNFEDKRCIETLIIRCNKPDIRINGFAIKRDHGGTPNSILFISTDIGLVYTIFNTQTGSLFREPAILNDTLVEGSVVVTSTGVVYYANKQEHTIHELYIIRDFRVRYGKILKSNAIKAPFGLITDECNHLYIATRSMILVMLAQSYKTIRSIFSKASDLPITIERLNSTTYVYATVKKSSGKIPSTWMFNILYFTDPEKYLITTRFPVVSMEEKLDFDESEIDNTKLPKLWPISGTSLLRTTNLINIYTHLPSTAEVSEQTQTSSTDQTTKQISTFSTLLSTEVLTSTVVTSPSVVTDIISSTSSSHDPSTTQEQSVITDFSTLNQLDQSFLSSDSTTPTQLPSTIPDEIITDHIDKEMEDGINHKHSSPMSIEVYASSTLHPSSPFIVSSTTFISSHSSQLSSSSPHPLLTLSSTTSPNLYPLLSSIHFSAIITTTTTTSTFPTTLTPSLSTLQTTDSVITSDITEQSSITTSSSESSSPLVTSYPDSTSTASSLLLLTTTDNQLTSQSSNIFYHSSSYVISSESSSDDYEVLLTSTITSTMLDSTTTVRIDEPTTVLLETTNKEETFAITSSLPIETTSIPSTLLPSTSLPSTLLSSITEKYTSTQSSLGITSTTFQAVYSTKIEHSTLVVTHSSLRSIRPSRKRTRTTATTSATTIPNTTPSVTTKKSYRSSQQTPSLTTEKPFQTSQQTPSTTSSITTKEVYQTSQQTVTLWTSQPSPIIRTTTSIQTTPIYEQLSTFSPIVIWHSKLNPLLSQDIVIIKPLFSRNASNTLLSDELFKSLFSSSTNSSTEKLIYFNLIDLPPSSWNISLHTNASILLDIALPTSNPSNFNTTTNLSITNIEANRFSTNIIGVPINLQVDKIQAKQFSLAMDLTHNQTNQSLSDVVIGRIKSEQFELNITKSDNMNVHVQQVDSETAELFFDSQFCTNETNLQINLNLSKNGTIRYGNRTPLRIGPVFTRVHMLKQSCHLDQPFTLFFDICLGQNPCLNGGTCNSQTPDYDNPSYDPQASSQINYHCICPLHMLGEHCQHSQYPTGYCINGGSLVHTFNSNNKPIVLCSCARGFQGVHCENNIDDCVGIHCSNHGICQDEVNTYTCSCFDGYYGDKCEQKNVETVLLQVASKSFATVAILLIASIAGLFVASDIHTYLTREKQTVHDKVPRIPRAKSELFENSVLLLGFGDAPIEMNDLSIIDRGRKPTTTTAKQRPINRRKKISYQQLPKTKHMKKSQKPSTKSFLLSNPSYETIL